MKRRIDEGVVRDFMLGKSRGVQSRLMEAGMAVDPDI